MSTTGHNKPYIYKYIFFIIKNIDIKNNKYNNIFYHFSTKKNYQYRLMMFSYKLKYKKNCIGKKHFYHKLIYRYMK